MPKVLIPMDVVCGIVMKRPTIVTLVFWNYHHSQSVMRKSNTFILLLLPDLPTTEQEAKKWRHILFQTVFGLVSMLLLWHVEEWSHISFLILEFQENNNWNVTEALDCPSKTWTTRQILQMEMELLLFLLHPRDAAISCCLSARQDTSAWLRDSFRWRYCCSQVTIREGGWERVTALCHDHRLMLMN